MSNDRINFNLINQNRLIDNTKFEESLEIIEFPYIDKYFDWIQFNSIFWEYLDGIEYGSESRRDLIKKIWSFPNFHRNMILNLPMSINSDIASKYFLNWEEYYTCNKQLAKSIDGYELPGFYSIWKKMIESMSSINEELKNQSTPMLNKLIDLISEINTEEKSTNKKISLIFKDNFMNHEISKAIIEELNNNVLLNKYDLDIKIKTYKSLKNVDLDLDFHEIFSFDELQIFFGIPDFKDEFQQFLIFYPFAERIKILYYDIPSNNNFNTIDFSIYSLHSKKNNSIKKFIFPKSKSTYLPPSDREYNLEYNLDYDITQEMNEFHNSENSPNNEFIHSFALHLVSDYLSFFPNSNSKVPILDTHSMELKSLERAYIQIGYFVILRMGNDPDLIKEISDNALNTKDLNILRNFMDWKNIFSEYISKQGYDHIIEELNDKVKIQHLNYSTIDRWASFEENDIGPGSDEDFFELLKILKIDHKFQVYLKSNNTIRSSRIHAGRLITNVIRKSIQNKTAKEQLFSTGHLSFTVDESKDIKIEALRIIEIIDGVSILKNDLRKITHRSDL